MREIDQSTGRGQALVWRYNMAEARSLYELYKRPSQAKAVAWQWVQDRMRKIDGALLHSTRLWGNCQYFNVGFRLRDGTLVVITSCNEYHVKGAFKWQ